MTSRSEYRSRFAWGRWIVACCVALVALGLPSLASEGMILIETKPPLPGLGFRVSEDCHGSLESYGGAKCKGLPAREYQVSVTTERGLIYTQSCSLNKKMPHGRVEFLFDWYRITTNVQHAEVRINGHSVGNVGVERSLELWLGEGRAAVEVSKEGFSTATESLDVSGTSGRALRAQVMNLTPSAASTTSKKRATSSTPTSGTQWWKSDEVIQWSLIGLLALVVLVTIVVAVHVIRQARGAAYTTQRVDRYEVYNPVGHGGMATVYYAKDTLRERKGALALKVMNDNLMHDPDLVHKFLREGEILRQLNHQDPEAPLVEVFHFGRVGGVGVPFIAMELLSGESLLQLIQRRRQLSLKESATIAAGVARALRPAHAIGVYHRDLSPENIIMTNKPKGGFSMRLIDFGVARHEYTTHGTLDGSITGKPPFMSPELCRGHGVDQRTDVYALGIVLFTMLTGSPPFTSSNPLEVMAMHQNVPVTFPEQVPDTIRPLLEHALAKRKEDRLPNMEMFFAQLQEFAHA